MSKSARNGKTAAGPARLALITAPGTLVRIGRTIGHLATGLLDEPMNLTLIAPEGDDLSGLPIPPIEVLTYPTPRFGRHGHRMIEELAGHMERSGVEFLHCLDGRAHVLTRRLSDRGQWPYFISVYDVGQCRQLPLLGAHCCGVIAASLALRQALLGEHVAPADRTHLVRPGLRAAADLARRADRSGSTAIIATGSLDDFAAFDRVVNSFAALRADDYDCVLLIMGRGAAEMRLRARVKELKLTHDVSFVDRLGQRMLPDVFAAADVVVHPVTAGWLETEILEAMGAGAVVLVGGPTVGDFVIDGETAVSYAGTASGGLTAKLRGLLDDPRLAVQLTTRAHEHVRRHHSPTAMVAALGDLYQRSALGGRMAKQA